VDWERFYQNYRKPNYIKGYEIVNKLGVGVFGEVFKLRKISIGKFYAIKFLRVEDESLKNAVVRELESVKLLAQIDHPNLVSIEDQGEVDGIPFIIMSYAGEKTLKSLLQDGPLPVERTTDYFRQICAGVQALHERSIIHFDLKPANIYLKGELARVGDYGLSKLISRTRRSLSFGRGTPYYMAPEMLKRRGDQRSDVYSLGVILFECLSGDVPFKGDTEWQVLKQHESQPIVFPDNVPEQFRPALRTAMAKEPGDRFQTVAEFRQAVGPKRRAVRPGSPRERSPVSAATEGAAPATERPGGDPETPLSSPVGGSWSELLLVPFQLVFFTLRKLAGLGWTTVVALAKVPVRLLEWGLHLVVFLVMVVIFFTVLHLLFKLPLIFLGWV